eukprot:TRINITY_DN30525_c0_g1_i1.p1 TRINITY_DN30525_c0_g1~~TRINITY_DN30525_c0_g1_i1.p1  ORF type:complete len:392 (+),score=85.87 TRINITY_DN30525_c0_g1_i1:35-1210(+)
MSDRLVLLDASKVTDQALEALLQRESVTVWFQGGQQADESVDNAKLDALKVALDVGALSQDEYQQAVSRLVAEDPFKADEDRLALLRTALEGGALTEDLFKDAIGRLHLASGVQVGDMVEVRDDLASEWKAGSVTRITTETGKMQVFVQLNSYRTSHVWEYLRKPDVSMTAVEQIRKELANVTAERDRLQNQIQTMLREGTGGGGGLSRVLKTRASPLSARYEMYGLAFAIHANVMVRITGVTFGSRAVNPARITAYKCIEVSDRMLHAPNRWSPVSETGIIPAPTVDPFSLPITTALLIPANTSVTILIHSPDDMQAITYDRADSLVVQEDGCLQVMGADAAQKDMATNSTSRGFAFCGEIEYEIVDMPSSTPPSVHNSEPQLEDSSQID